MGLMMASKAFCKLLFNSELSASFDQLIAESSTPKIEAKQPTAPPPPARPAAPKRSEAISLLSALQREARLLDLVTESLDGYSDAQIGAAAKEVLRDSGSVIERMFGLKPMTDAADGTELQTPTKFDAAEYRLTGNVSGEGPFRGAVAHHGWKATKCDVPKWAGAESSALIIAPIELEIKS